MVKQDQSQVDFLSDEGKSLYQAKKYLPAAASFARAAEAYQEAGQIILAAEMRNNQSVALLLAKEPRQALEAVQGTSELFLGAGQKTTGGMALANDRPIVSFVGDSTFFHGSIPGVINAIHNKHNYTYVVLDNRTTAMTGHQPHPGIPVDGLGDPAPALKIEEVGRGLGAEFVEVTDALNVEMTTDVVKRAVAHEGFSLVVAKGPCALLDVRDG